MKSKGGPASRPMLVGDIIIGNNEDYIINDIVDNNSMTIDDNTIGYIPITTTIKYIPNKYNSTYSNGDEKYGLIGITAPNTLPQPPIDNSEIIPNQEIFPNYDAFENSKEVPKEVVEFLKQFNPIDNESFIKKAIKKIEQVPNDPEKPKELSKEELEGKLFPKRILEL